MKNKKAKGSVLYTVVSVMMIMTVFIFAALALASASNKRAFNTYANNQTQYTARSVIDSICKALETNEEFSSSFSGLNKGDTKDVTVNLPGAEMGSVLNASVTNIGVGTDFGIDSIKPVYKISANVKMLGRENTAALYVLADYAKNTSPFQYSLVSLKDASISDNFSALGGSSFGIQQTISGMLTLNNDINLNGFSGINGSVELNQASIKVSDPGYGFYVNGDLTFNNGGQKVSSAVTNMIPYKELPYLYVDGTLNCGNTDASVGDADHPVNVYAGNIVSNHGDRFYGDVYLFDEHKYDGGIEEGLSNFELVSYSNGLYSWTDNLVNKKNGNGSSYIGGNLYSKGKVRLNAGQSGANHIFGSDVISDELELGGSNGGSTQVTINGATVVKNELSISSVPTFNFNKGLFVDPDKANIESNININGAINVGEAIKGPESTVTYTPSLDAPLICDKSWQEDFKISPADDDSTYFFDDGHSVKEIKVEWESDTALESLMTQFTCKIATSWWGTGSGEKLGTIEYLNETKTSGTITFDTSSDISYCTGQNMHIFLNMGDMSTGKGNPLPTPIRIKSVTCKTYDVSYNYDYINYIKKVNEPVFSNNGGTIYIDNIDQSIKIETLDAAGNVTGDPSQFASIRVSSVLLSEEESMNLANNGLPPAYVVDKTYNYSTEYAQFLKDIVSNYSNMFPSSMTRESLKSNKTVDDSFIQPEMAQNMIANGKTSTDVYSTVNFDSKPVYCPVANSGGMYMTYFGDDGNKYCKKMPFSAFADPDHPVITDSCTITGYLNCNNDIIYIDPGNKEIWIRLVDFMATSTVIVVNDEGGGKVNFFVPKEGESIDTYISYSDDPVLISDTNTDEWWCNPISASSGSCTLDKSRIVTKYYHNLGGNYDLLQNPDASNADEKKTIPNINFYIDSEGNNGVLTLQNGNALITGYIMAPTAKFNNSANGGSIDGSSSLKYDGVDYGQISPAIIGAAVFDTVGIANPAGFVYINPGADTNSNSGLNKLGKFTTLYYQCG